jgi:hypothetical protein
VGIESLVGLCATAMPDHRARVKQTREMLFFKKTLLYC